MVPGSRFRTTAGVVSVAVALVALVPTASATTARVNLSSAHEQASDGSYGPPVVSADGRYVTFSSAASNLVPNDRNGVRDVFVRDLRTGQTQRVSVDDKGCDGCTSQAFSTSSDSPVISSDGRFVAFAADGQMLVFDRRTDAPEPVGRYGPDDPWDPLDGALPGWPRGISTDGRFVLFSSGASDLVPGDSGFTDVFVHDRSSGETERVSVNRLGGQANHASVAEAISADGRYVAFTSWASDLVEGDTNGVEDAFVQDLETGRTERVSVDGAKEEGNASSRVRAITPDGRFVAFESSASNLVPGDTNGRRDIFVRGRDTATTERVSVTSAEGQTNGHSRDSVAISADGRYVAFESLAGNISTTPVRGQVFRRDRQLGKTTLMSVGSDGARPDFASGGAAISADGQTVAFFSGASNLVNDDTNGGQDVFVNGPVSTPPPPTCEGRAATIVGSGGPDMDMHDTDEADVIVGLGGSDSLHAFKGNDVICGDGGATEPVDQAGDLLTAGGGNDVLIGQGGPDRLYGRANDDELFGGPDADLLHGGGDRDSLYGEEGDDRLENGPEADLVSGGSGTDFIDYWNRTAPVEVTIGDGPNDGAAGEGDDVRADVERARGGKAADRLVGDAGANSLYGSDGDDELVGAPGSDTLRGDAGNDRIESNDGEIDKVSCGTELDTVLGDPLDVLSSDCEIRPPN